MNYHVLRHNKKVSIPKHFLFFDTEANEVQISEDIKLQKFKLAVACYYRRDIKQEVWLKTKSQRLLAAFFDHYCYKSQTLYVFAHNIFYDTKLSRVIELLVKNHGYEIDRVYLTHSDTTIIRLKKGNKRMVFIDTLNYFKCPLRELGKVVGCEKMEIDIFNASEKELFEYCKRDVEIIKKAILRLCEFLEKNDLGSFGWTVSSIAFKVFRHKFMKHKICIHHNKEVQELEKNAYYGGRVEVYVVGKRLQNVYKLDVNSMYPYVMKKYRYPTKLVKYVKECSIDELKRRIKNGFLAIGRFVVETNEPVYPFRHKGKLYFPVNRFETYLSTPEIEYALKKGHIKEVKEVAFYGGDYIFKDFVNTLYNERLNAKKDNRIADVTFFKYLLNSLYGKFGQREREILYELKTDDIQYYCQDSKLNGIPIDEIGFYNKVFYVNKEEKFSFNSFCAIAVHVTAYARMYLYKLIKKAGIKNVYYVDTDSLFVNEEGYKRLSKYLDNYELGKLKLEDIGELIAYNVKNYEFNNLKKCKGIPKKAECKDGVYYWWSFEKLRGSLRKQLSLEGVHLIIRHRRLVTPYDKRIVKPDGTTEPLPIEKLLSNKV